MSEVYIGSSLLNCLRNISIRHKSSMIKNEVNVLYIIYRVGVSGYFGWIRILNLKKWKRSHVGSRTHPPGSATLVYTIQDVFVNVLFALSKVVFRENLDDRERQPAYTVDTSVLYIHI